ncbi:MAG: FliA/WhiG family RNA polymerase sigma factor [Candidatus Acidiferrales bacterium]
MSAGVILKRIEPEPPRMALRRAEVETTPTDPQREQVLLEHLAQVHYIARRIHDRLPPQVLLEDLVHAGILGLMDAVRKYDPSKNVLLKHYAEFRIRGAILDSLRQIDWSPRTLRRQAKRVEQAKFACRARLGRDPSEPEIAEEVGISLKRLQRILGEVRGLDVSSLHSENAEPNGEDAIDPPAAADEDPFHLALRSEMTGLLDKALGELAARERDVLALYHFEELTMKEVGAILGIGESRVSQIHSAALLRLRTRLRQLTAKAPPAVPGPVRVGLTPLRNTA